MKISIGSSFWIFGLTVILNSIELSSQSETPGRQRQGYRLPEIFSRQGFRPGYIPFRKVRCPRPEQLTLHSSFMMKNEQGFYENCTQDKILLAVGSTIVGHILEGRIHPISGFRGTEIIYDEERDRQVVAGIGWLREHVGLYNPVPPETLRSNVIYEFGAFREQGDRSSTRHRRPTVPGGPDEIHVGSETSSIFDSDSDTSSTSSFSRSSSFSSNPSTRPGSPRKK